MSKNFLWLSLGIFSLLLCSCSKDEIKLSKGFIKYFGGAEFDDASDMQQTSDGGYIIVGSTSSRGLGGSDIFLIKTDANGNEEWSKTYGGILDDDGMSVCQTSDGGYAVLGTLRYSSPGVDSNKTDIFFIKTNSSGDSLFTKKLGFSGYNDEAACVRQVSGGNYIVLGSTDTSGNKDIFTTELNPTGGFVWPQLVQVLPIPDPLNPDVQDVPVNILKTSAGGYIISTNAAGSGFGPTPRIINTNTIGQQNNAPEKTQFAEPTMNIGGSICYAPSDNTYLLTGQTTGGDIFVLKVTPVGANLNKTWYKTYGTGGIDIGQSVQATSDGGFVVLGSTTGAGTGARDIYLLKMDASGDNVEWTQTFGGTGLDAGRVVRQTSDGGYAILGAIEFGDDPSNSDNIICLIKVDEFGEITNY